MRSEIDSPAKRARLAARKNPYWQGVSGGRGGVSLGYRRASKGAGTWVAKIVLDGRRLEERLATADDDGAPADAITFRAAVSAALDWSRRQHAAIERQGGSGKRVSSLTVRSAVDEYIRARSFKPGRVRSTAKGRLSKHVLPDEEFASLPLSKLRAPAIQEWRARLPERIAPATVNRILNDLRAALNAAAEAHRAELPSRVAMEIKIGTKALSVRANARKQLLTDEQIARLIAAAFEVDPEGDFGRLVMLAAATGARFSQLAVMTVGSVQREQARVLVPGSSKGRAARPRAPTAVPISPEVLARLEPVLEREAEEPLLLRWAYKQTGPFKWERSRRQAWTVADEVDEPWREAVERAGAPQGTVMYALRHSSIVRGLRAGLPVRLVAALHDTSSEMIEAHYSAYIVDATEEITRRAALAF